MRIHIVNPSDVSFGTAVITPRWLYVLAAATPAQYGTPLIVDETLEPFVPETIESGDVVGIGIHTANALRGYQIGRIARERGATVVFGGIHSTLYPDEAREHGAAHAVVKGDGDIVWSQVLADLSAAKLAPLYDGGRIEGGAFLSARWDLLPADKYMWGSVQTIRGCPKHCSFCSVWRTDGQKPRQRTVDDVVREVVALRRRGFRFILLSDDNFYPVTLADLAAAGRRADKSHLENLKAIRAERFELMAQLEQLPDDLVFYTQITMEAAEDPEFLIAMRKAKIRGALVGIESVTPEGLKAVFKDFNHAGEALVTTAAGLRTSRGARPRLVHLRLADRQAGYVQGDGRSRAACGRVVRAVRHAAAVSRHGGLWKVGEGSHPLPSLWTRRRSRATGSSRRRRVRRSTPRILLMSADEIRQRTQATWDEFYRFPLIWKRSKGCVKSLRARLTFVLISKLYRQMYANTGIATDSARVARSARRARVLARLARKLFITSPMPELEMPLRRLVPERPTVT